MIAFLVILVFASGSLANERVPFFSCKGGDTVSAIVMNPCNLQQISSTKSACFLQHGTIVKVNAVFVAPFSSSNLEIVASATINNHVIPLPDTGSNPCQGKLVPGCPVKKDDLYIFKYNFDIQKFYPTGSLEVKFGIRDKKTKNLLGCAIVPVVITRNPEMRYASQMQSGIVYV